MPDARMYEGIEIPPRYQQDTLPPEEARIADARRYLESGYKILLGSTGNNESYRSTFEQNLAQKRSSLRGELVLGPHVTWPDGPEMPPFTPAGLAIWHRIEDKA
jgi:hypothetical protein